MRNEVTSTNPATGEHVGAYPLDDEARIHEKIFGATVAQARWSRIPREDRARVLEAVATKVRALRTEIAKSITAEIGMPLGQSTGEVDKGLQLLDEVARNGPSQLEPRYVQEAKSRIEYAPLGVCLSVAPWNFPFYLALRSIVPNLMAGNVVLLKHSVTCQGVAKLIEECFRVEGAPEDIVTNLVIRGAQAESLLARPEIRLATLIGSERAGRSFAKTAASHLKPVILELGGNDALVVMGDANLPEAARAAADSRLRNAGQACNAAKRFLVAESVRDEFVDLLRKEYDRYRPGDTWDPKTLMGPVATPEAASTYRHQCDALDRHGVLYHRVEAPKGLTGPCWVEPRLYVLDADTAYQEEEIFGPAAILTVFETPSEAISLVNESRFGLGCSVWTGSKETFEWMAERIETGNVFHNSMVRSHVGLPYGGVKDSGYGRELGLEGLRGLTNVKVVYTG